MVGKVAKFSINHPFVGPLLWIASLQYYVAQILVATAWPQPYSWKNNYISDLGNTVCGTFEGVYTCSPLYVLMNLSFVLFGLTIIFGALLLKVQLAKNKGSHIAYMLMILSGIGTVMVGVFPENSISLLHIAGAFLALVIGNISVVLIGMFSHGVHRSIRAYSVLSGVVCWIAFGLFYTENYLGLGRGGMERVVSYPFTLWMAVFGAYIGFKRLRFLSPAGDVR